jgi:hypothetical protein
MSHKKTNFKGVKVCTHKIIERLNFLFYCFKKYLIIFQIYEQFKIIFNISWHDTIWNNGFLVLWLRLYFRPKCNHFSHAYSIIADNDIQDGCHPQPTVLANLPPIPAFIRYFQSLLPTNQPPPPVNFSKSDKTQSKLLMHTPAELVYKRTHYSWRRKSCLLWHNSSKVAVILDSFYQFQRFWADLNNLLQCMC